MKIQINFKVINVDFNQAYADEYKDGEESDNNMKYHWEVRYEEKNTKSVELIENGIYQLTGQFKDGTEFNLPIPNVAIFRCFLEDGTVVDYAVSKAIINKTHQAKNEKHNVTRCYFYLNAEPESVQLGNNLVIDLNEMPSQLHTKSE
jgi:hypothetical protein